MFLHTYAPNPILAEVGRLTIHWYGLFLAIGALAGYLTFMKLGRRYGLKQFDLENLFFVEIIAGLLGARIYHVLNEWPYYAKHPAEIMSVWNGGLAIHGAVIAGLLAAWWFTRARKIPFWLIADIAVPALAIGQAIGRWGNYFNQELFGRPTALPWGIPIEQLNRPIQYLNDVYFHPTFLYESLGSLAVFGILILLHKKRLARQDKAGGTAFPAGIIALAYFIAEPIIRIVTETLRVDKVPIVFGVRLPLLVSILIAGAASILLIRRIRRSAT